MNKQEQNVNYLQPYIDLAEKGLKSSAIAEKLNCTPEWVRQLKTVKTLVDQNPVLEEFVMLDKIAISTAVKSYKDYGDLFLANLNFAEKLALESDKKTITNAIVTRAIKLAQIKYAEDDSANQILSSTIAEHQINYEINGNKKAVLQCPLKKRAAEKTIKQFWADLVPQIDNINQEVDLGRIPINFYISLSEAMGNF